MFRFNRVIVMSQFGAGRHEIHFELASENLFYLHQPEPES